MPPKPEKIPKKKTTMMSGTSGAVRESEVWCYTKEEDVVESAVRAVSASVRSAAASHQGASVCVWAKADTQTAMQKLREHLGIDVGKITEPQEADVYVEVRVEKRVVAAWWVHVDRTEHVVSAGTEEEKLEAYKQDMAAEWPMPPNVVRVTEKEELADTEKAVKGAVAAGIPDDQISVTIAGIVKLIPRIVERTDPEEVEVVVIWKNGGNPEDTRRWCVVLVKGERVYLTGTYTEDGGSGGGKGIRDTAPEGGFRPSDARHRNSSETERKGRIAHMHQILAEARQEKAELEAGLVRCGDTELMAAELGEMGLKLSVEWADRNLDVWKMSDGVKVVEAEKKEEWGLLTKKGVSVWCHYEGDKESCKKWGKMYSMGNVEELEKLAPLGWRIPTGGEWRELLEAHGLRFDDDGITIVSNEQEVKAVVEALLDGPFKGAGNGGCRDQQGRFAGMAMWWVMTGGHYGLEYVIVLQQQDTMGMGDVVPPGLGYYVRCVRDKP
jgi:uncharacterized protein (TIGR02145 family)